MTSFMPAVVSKPLIHGAERLRGAIANVSWGPLLFISKVAVTTLLSRIEVGQVVVENETTGETNTYGQKSAQENPKLVNGLHDAHTKSPSLLTGKLIVKKESFWVRLFLFGDMGFAEAFMLGDVECEDLTIFFEIFIYNRNQLANATTLTSSLTTTITGLARGTNTLANSLLNAVAHYDISNDMFSAFLSPDMTYSCPIWRSAHAHADADNLETLEEAQMTKLHRFIDGAKIKATDHVLEIGTGWGSFAIEAVRSTGCRVTSLTLSAEQKSLADQRIAAASLQDKIEVLLMDYRELPKLNQLFDKIVSIEMLEAVGREYLETYFGCIHQVLKKDGIAVFQCITMSEGRYEAYAKGEDFIRKYIFPGGHLPSICKLVQAISKGSDGTLIVERIENIGGHYAKTLRLWKEEFILNFESKIKPALMRDHKEMGEREIEVFRKKWIYYFVYCEAGFATKTLGDVIITVGREGAMELMEGIPR